MRNVRHDAQMHVNPHTAMEQQYRLRFHVAAQCWQHSEHGGAEQHENISDADALQQHGDRVRGSVMPK